MVKRDTYISKARGYAASVFDNNGREIDFLAELDGKKYYVQVAYSVADDKAQRDPHSAEGFSARRPAVRVLPSAKAPRISFLKKIPCFFFALSQDDIAAVYDG